VRVANGRIERQAVLVQVSNGKLQAIQSSAALQPVAADVAANNAP
jgi:hypothetical protein